MSRRSLLADAAAASVALVQTASSKIRQFSFTIDACSIITFPSYPAKVEKGWIEIRASLGVAGVK
ncbi:hypothetical protein [Dyadobacter jiangsuensis]